MRVVAKRPFYFSTNSLPIHSVFQLPSPIFSLPSSNFGLRSSDFRLPTSLPNI